MILFSPGPANITERVRRALLLPDISHRGPEFGEMLAEIRTLLLDVCGVPNGYRSVLFTGSGSVGIESIISAIRGMGRLLVVSNGVYGSRAASMARYFGVPIEEWELPWGEMPNPEDLHGRLAQGDFRAVYLVHHETTTGLLNPLPELARVTKARGLVLLVDGISSVAGEHIHLEDWGVDAFLGSTNKCIRGVSGLAFAVVSRRLVDELPREEYAHYSSLRTHLEAEDRGETPFTPAVHSCYALREALHELRDEGLDQRIRHFEELSAVLRGGLQALGLKLLLPEKDYSNTMLSFRLPTGFTFKTLNEACRARGFSLYEGQGYLRDQVFRLGLVGSISLDDAGRFVEVMRDELSKNR